MPSTGNAITICRDLEGKFEELWTKADLGEEHIKEINRRLDRIVQEVETCQQQQDKYGYGEIYDPPNEKEFLNGLESLAYVATERLAQLCAGGMRWSKSDKARFLSPTVDFLSLVQQRATAWELQRPISEQTLTAIQSGSWDFLQVAEQTESWFEASSFSRDDVSYLLWAAHRAVSSIGGKERVPGFTAIALSNDRVLDEFCSCESPIESVLYMSLVTQGLLPPTLVVQWQVGRYRLDMAIPEAWIDIECDGDKYHSNKRTDSERDRYLRNAGWNVQRFRSWRILDAPDSCVWDIHELFPWT